MRRRDQGGVAFLDLADSTGATQIIVNTTNNNVRALTACRLGDWVGVDGVPTTSRRGTPSILASGWQLLAENMLGFPDKTAGITDHDARYRQRAVDLWVTPGARNTLIRRSQIISALRNALTDENYLEVETPILQPIHGGANARPFVTHHRALGVDRYLRIAPELYLKTLVAAGMERVFELGRVFRNEGISPRHNPEFTMVEIYAAYADYNEMMCLTERLFEAAALTSVGSVAFEFQGQPLSFEAPFRRATMVELVAEHTGVTFDLHGDIGIARRQASELSMEADAGWGIGRILAEVFDQRVADALWQPTFVIDHPVETSPLARRHRSDDTVVERFELFVCGRELANAYSELQNADEQLARFEEQAAMNEAGDDEAMLVDHDYVRTLRWGLPPTGGLGIGIDRLVMLLSDSPTIRDVLAFPALRPRQDHTDTTR